MDAPDEKTRRNGVPRPPIPGQNRAIRAVIDRPIADKSDGSSAPSGSGDSGNPLAEPDDNIEMVAPPVQEQTGSER